MTILAGDIQLLKSQVMTDADNGGGAATGVVVADGVSNDIFTDVSELDHVYGRVSLRKVFVGVHTDNTDTYLGANVILSQPPGNPDVSAVLFSTTDDFDRRTDAASRIESYLAAGPSYPGYLFGDHIAGQLTVTLQQRANIPLPSNGDTLVLVKYPGTVNEFRQFVRVTDVAATARDFTTTSSGADVTFTRLIVSLTISQVLEQDFPGFDAVYADASVAYASATEVLGSVVADAARYYGVVPLTQAASFGDFAVVGDSIFAQLVPSSRTEIPIADSRMNEQLSPLVATGVNVDSTLLLQLDSGHPAFVGGGILPGTFSLTNAGVLTGVRDKGGALVDSVGNTVGTIDYASGELTLSTNVFGTGTTSKHLVYSRAAESQVVSNSIGVDVTDLNRRLTWVITFDPIPAKGSLTASYLSQGHWYELTDDGSGALRGADSSFGVGVLNLSTGTLSLTLGALPDSPSSIILQWADQATSPAVPALRASASDTFAYASQEIDLGVPFNPGTLTITWAGGKTSTDAVGATLGGDAKGRIEYATGKVYIAPSALPAPGTVMTATVTQGTPAGHSVAAYTDAGANWTFAVTPGTGGIQPHSLKLSALVSYPASVYPGADQTLSDIPQDFADDGAGNIVYSGHLPTDGSAFSANVGTVNYATGACTLAKTFTLKTIQPLYQTVYPLDTSSSHTDGYIKNVGDRERDVTATIQNGGVGGVSDACSLLWSNSGTGPVTVTRAFDSPLIQTALSNTVLAPGATFSYGGKSFLTLADGTVQMDVSSSTGVGTPAGSWVAATGAITVSNWTAGATSTVSSFSATSSPPTASTAFGPTPQVTDGVTFRTASAPIAPAGFQVLGTTSAGVAFSVTADSQGHINGSGVVGVIDYATGIVRLRFGTPSTAALSDSVIDISSYGVTGVTKVALAGVVQDSLRYNAVAYDYIPLDPAILGLDPVRLPSDGRVPIFKKGEVAVVHYTHTTAPATHLNGDVVDLGETRVSSLIVKDSTGSEITAGFTPNLDTGHVTIDSISGWSQPVTMTWRIEDAALVTDAQLSGRLQLSRQLSHDFPIGSYVSSAYLIGDMQARVSAIFEQQTWTSVWQDTPIGNPILARYNDIDHPPVVTNAAAVTESWALIFTSSTAFSIVGEHLGTIGVGSTATDCAPLNTATGTPYFELAAVGFGTGWSIGNVIRINTVGAHEPLWLARVVQQGDNTLDNDSFTVLVRGDVNA